MGETEDNFTLRPDIKSAWPLKNEGDIDQYLKQNLLEQSMRLQAIQQNSEKLFKSKKSPYAYGKWVWFVVKLQIQIVLKIRFE